MRYLWLLLPFSLFLTSCEQFFNQVIEVELPESNPKIVLDARVEAGDSVMSVFVSRSRSILDNSEYDYEATFLDSIYFIDINGDSFLYVNTYFQRYDTISDVVLELFKNNVSQGFIPALQSGYHEINFGFSKNETDIYELKASASGYESVSAVTKTPVVPEIQSVSFSPGQGGGGVFGEDLSNLDVVIKDNSTDINYYLVEIYQRYSEQELYNLVFASTSDPLASVNSSGGVIISDESFNGGVYNLRLGVYNDLTEVDAKVVVRSITKDDYLFNRSVVLYNRANGNPFAEPVILHSNVVNGYGLFSIRNSTEKKIE